MEVENSFSQLLSYTDLIASTARKTLIFIAVDAFRGGKALAASFAVLSPGSKVLANPPGKIRTINN